VHGTHLFLLSNDEQAGLEAAAVVVAASASAVRNGFKFSQYNVVWGSFPQARDSGC
jgi:hypothetical protein